jgi:hypothetical protein
MLNPRVCDCDYCQTNPSEIISDPSLKAEFRGGSYIIRQNGDQLANFYYCDSCSRLLAAGCLIGKSLRGAINCGLFSNNVKFGQPINVQPRLLSSSEKIKRWGKLWGKLSGL